jgi:hypothetical protein
MRCPSCGFDSGNANRRSVPDHRRLMALIHKALHNWPEAHPFKPLNFDHLRAWLVCSAGPEWRVVKCTFLDANTRSIVAEALRDILDGKATEGEQGSEDMQPIVTRFVKEFSDGVAVFAPKSMKFEAMEQAEFRRLRDAITEVIEAEIGCKADDLLQEVA